MTFRKKQALQNELCMKDCHDSFLQAWDRGRLTLVNCDWFHFFFQVQTKVAESFTEEKLNNETDVALSARNSVLKNAKLMKLFNQRSRVQEHTGMTQDRKKKVFLEILEKAINVTCSDVINRFRDENVMRGSKNKPTNLNTRSFLDSLKLKEQQSEATEAPVI